VLEKFGIPQKMLSLIIRLHSDLIQLIVKVNVGDKDVCYDSDSGSTTGKDAPWLLCYLQSISRQQMKFYHLFSLSSTLIFKTEKDFVLSGRKITQSAEALEFSFDKSLYADDRTKWADSRGNLQKNNQLIFSVFR
jgi:hypothetical protein